MRLIVIIASGFLTLSAFGQIRNIKVPEVRNIKVSEDRNGGSNKSVQRDTLLKVLYVDKNTQEKSPAYYLNGQFINGTIIKTLDPNRIENIRVEKLDLEIEEIKYDGQIFIETKADYKPKLISLTELKLKYTNIKNGSTLFMIDNEIVNEDFDNYLVDENFLLRISVQKIENAKEKLNLNLVSILTKTEQNIKKVNTIWIRG